MAALNKKAEEVARKKGRRERFAVQVVSRYKFTCALTGLLLDSGRLDNSGRGAYRNVCRIAE